MIRVILARPLGPRNVGMALRAAANFGPAEFWIVAPRRPSILVHPEFEQMAHGVEDFRERIQVAATLDEALADCTGSVGFTARPRDNRERHDWHQASDGVAERCADTSQLVGLCFGSDEGGLSKRECDAIEQLCYLRTSEEHTSINLAMSVGIVLSSLYRGKGMHRRESELHLIDGHAREFLRLHMKSVFGEDVARTPSARRDIEGAIDRLLSRAPIENRDARAWHLMLRAMGSRKTPRDFGLDEAPKNARRDEAQARSRARRAPDADHEGVD